MKTSAESSVKALVEAFESTSLPKQEWTHEAHLKVGLWYVSNYPREEATGLLRTGIQNYNAAHGTVTTESSGYHETITLFYIWALAHFLKNHPAAAAGSDLDELAQNMLNTPYADRNFPLQYYSKKRLFSWEARRYWLEPDLKPLD